MAKSEINLRVLKQAVNSVLDHLIEDLNLETVPIEDGKDFYWDCPATESKRPNLAVLTGRWSS